MVASQLKFSFNPLTNLCLWLSAVMVMLCLASPAVASLSGNVELVYTDFSAEEDGEEVGSLSAFSQTYSVFFDKSGFIGDRRFGTYNVGLGYEWITNSTTIESLRGEQDEDFNTHSGKVLFRGDVNIAPGALPFRFNAYSYDLSSAEYAYANTGRLLDSQIIVGTRSREEVYSGLSLMAGIRNGSYLGAYRSVLSKLPRIFIDYTQRYVRDVDGIYKEHSLLRDLAFVSLNKKDNWFHYRASDYTDHLDSDNDESDFTFILGTVDQRLKRQWINMTNWIKISVDGSYTEEDSPKNLTRDVDPSTFAVNFFTDSKYGKTRTSSFSNFNRMANDDKLETEYEIPFYANGWIDPNRSWSVQLRRYKYTEHLYDSGARNVIGDEEGEYLAARYGHGYLDAVKFDSTLELERAVKPETTGFAVKVRQEMSRNVNIKNPWLLGYTGLYINTDSDPGSTNDEDNVFEHELYGSSKWSVSPRNIFELRQSLRYANSVSTGVSTNFIVPKGSAGSSSNMSSAASSEALYVSETSLSLDSRLGPRLTNRVLLSHKSYSGGAEDVAFTMVQDEIRYWTGMWRFEMSNGLYFGDDVPDFTIGSTDGSGVIINEQFGILNDPNYLLSHYSSVEYSPNRNLVGSASFKYLLKDTDYSIIHRSYLEERSEYTFLSFTGRRRVLGRVYQEIDYETYSSDYYDASYLKLMVGASYYPTSYFELGGEMYYEWNDPQGDENMALSVFGALDFSKLSCVTRYSYGVSSLGEGPYDERKEHLFEAKIRKSF